MGIETERDIQKGDWVKCIESADYTFVKLGQEYKILDIVDTELHVSDGKKDIGWYQSFRFEPLPYQIGDKVVDPDYPNWCGVIAEIDKYGVRFTADGWVTHDFMKNLIIKKQEKESVNTDPRKPEQIKREYLEHSLQCRINDLEAELEKARLMESDLGKIRAALGTIEFNRIIKGE